MTFLQTYREEVLINRRSRARKARLAGRIIGFGLSACLVVALRTDPQLRDFVTETALRVMGAVSEPQAGGSAGNAQADAIHALGYAKGSNEARALEQLGISGVPEQSQPLTAQKPQSRIKVNRGGSG